MGIMKEAHELITGRKAALIKYLASIICWAYGRKNGHILKPETDSCDTCFISKQFMGNCGDNISKMSHGKVFRRTCFACKIWTSFLNGSDTESNYTDSHDHAHVIMDFKGKVLLSSFGRHPGRLNFVTGPKNDLFRIYCGSENTSQIFSLLEGHCTGHKSENEFIYMLYSLLRK